MNTAVQAKAPQIQVVIDEASFASQNWTETDKLALIACVASYIQAEKWSPDTDQYTLLGSNAPAKHKHEQVISYALPDGRHFHLFRTMTMKAAWSGPFEAVCQEAVGVKCYGHQGIAIKKSDGSYILTIRD